MIRKDVCGLSRFTDCVPWMFRGDASDACSASRQASETPKARDSENILCFSVQVFERINFCKFSNNIPNPRCLICLFLRHRKTPPAGHKQAPTENLNRTHRFLALADMTGS